jgi:hypothetical protein
VTFKQRITERLAQKPWWERGHIYPWLSHSIAGLPGNRVVSVGAEPGIVLDCTFSHRYAPIVHDHGHCCALSSWRISEDFFICLRNLEPVSLSVGKALCSRIPLLLPMGGETGTQVLQTCGCARCTILFDKPSRPDPSRHRCDTREARSMHRHLSRTRMSVSMDSRTPRVLIDL